MPVIGIIGGSGFDRAGWLEVTESRECATAYGAPSGPILRGTCGGTEVLFLARHGPDHRLPPHRINYRANIAALAALGTADIIATAAVGGISPDAEPGTIVIPDQIIDYTHGREHTLYDGTPAAPRHVDFTEPYTEHLRADLIAAAARAGLDVRAHGVYGATHGPRLETRAEIKRLASDGCTIVGMTGMPEAALAREAGLGYAACALVVNWAAGIDAAPITPASIERHLARGTGRLLDLIREFLRNRV